MRFDGPPSRLSELVEAARELGLEVDDDGLDRSDEFGWPGCGNGQAFVLAVVDDERQSPTDVTCALRAAHERLTGGSGDWIVGAGSFVYLPDGLEPEWYDRVVPIAEELHAAEATLDADRVRELRAQVERLVTDASGRAQDNVDAFSLFVSMLLDAEHPRREGPGGDSSPRTSG